ncbi:MAG: ABC transporter ATP-binding protein [Actinomycetales bacterium]|nr:ABC transporter ATP-binding protein [Actinomycetales bacterium]
MTTAPKVTPLRALPPAEPVLEVRGLSKWYGRTHALDALSLTVQPGEVVGFVGPNGAGKSTTLRILMGLVSPSGGTADILGQSALNGSPNVRSAVGYLPGSPALYPRPTSRECLRFLQRVRGIDCRARVAELSARLEVDLEKHIHDLSRGNKQKIALIAALMHSPRLLLLDEPTSGLDPLVQREVERVLREAAADGVGILLSSHVLSEVEALADRVVMLHQGRTVLSAAMADITGRLVQRLTFEFADTAAESWFEGVRGVAAVEAHARHVEVTVNGSQAAALDAAAKHGVIAVHSHEQRLEDVFTELIPERAA